MRDPKQSLSLLRRMAAETDGRLKFTRTMGMDEKKQREAHHLELLADAGLVEWWGDKFPRITNNGYDFIEAVDKNPESMEVFLEKIGRGIPLAQAIIAALKILS